MTGVLQLKLLAGARKQLRESTPGPSGRVGRRPLANIEIVGADRIGLHANVVARSELAPRVVGLEDRPVCIQKRHVHRERVQRFAQELQTAIHTEKWSLRRISPSYGIVPLGVDLPRDTHSY